LVVIVWIGHIKGPRLSVHPALDPLFDWLLYQLIIKLAAGTTSLAISKITKSVQ
jgi:hypothetical protein